MLLALAGDLARDTGVNDRSSYMTAQGYSTMGEIATLISDGHSLAHTRVADQLPMGIRTGQPGNRPDGTRAASRRGSEA